MNIQALLTMLAMGGGDLGLGQDLEQVEREEEQLPPPRFFVHFEYKTLQVVGVTQREQLDGFEPGEIGVVEIDSTTGVKLLSGEEPLVKWSIGYRGDKYEFRKVEQEFTPRVKLDAIIEVPRGRGHADIVIEAADDRTVSVSYDAEKLIARGDNVKLYFTRENDPSYLKCAFTLGVNTLNQIIEEYELEEWPNPLKLTLSDGTDDLSVYSVRSAYSIILKS